MAEQKRKANIEEREAAVKESLAKSEAIKALAAQTAAGAKESDTVPGASFGHPEIPSMSPTLAGSIVTSQAAIEKEKNEANMRLMLLRDSLAQKKQAFNEEQSRLTATNIAAIKEPSFFSRLFTHPVDTIKGVPSKEAVAIKALQDRLDSLKNQTPVSSTANETLPEFSTLQEAEASGLPDGTRVKIAGVSGVLNR
jgi:hypothetical protein